MYCDREVFICTCM